MDLPLAVFTSRMKRRVMLEFSASVNTLGQVKHCCCGTRNTLLTAYLDGFTVIPYKHAEVPDLRPGFNVII